MAVKQMTEVAEHINAMKKRYDAAVHTQEVQSLLNGWEVWQYLRRDGDRETQTYYVWNVFCIVISSIIIIMLYYIYPLS